MKFSIRHRRGFAYLIAALMVVAVSSRLCLTHGKDYCDSVLSTMQTAADNGSWILCDCPICHAEVFLATEAENFEYDPIISTLHYEYGSMQTSQANRIVVVSSLRGPPALS